MTRNRWKIRIDQDPFPSDLNPGLGGCKRRNSSTGTARRVCCIACGLVSDKAEKKKKKKNRSREHMRSPACFLKSCSPVRSLDLNN